MKSILKGKKKVNATITTKHKAYLLTQNTNFWKR